MAAIRRLFILRCDADVAEDIFSLARPHFLLLLRFMGGVVQCRKCLGRNTARAPNGTASLIKRSFLVYRSVMIHPDLEVRSFGLSGKDGSTPLLYGLASVRKGLEGKERGGAGLGVQLNKQVK